MDDPKILLAGMRQDLTLMWQGTEDGTAAREELLKIVGEYDAVRPAGEPSLVSELTREGCH